MNPDKVKDMSNVLSMEKRIQHNARLLSYATDKDCTIMTVVIIILLSIVMNSAFTASCLCTSIGIKVHPLSILSIRM